MRRQTAFVLLVLSAALRCAGEDRTERIEGERGWKELDYRGGVLVEERSFDSSGALSAERQFSPEALPILTRRYARAGGRLMSVEASDASGKPIGRTSYHYDRNGRPLIAVSEGVLGSGSVGMIASAGSPQGAWIEDEGETSVLAYDGDGRVSILQRMKEGKVLNLERRTYGAKGVLSSVSIEDRVAEIGTTISYDEAGRETGRKVVGPKGEPSESSFRYDESGRVVEETRVSGEHATSIGRSYAKDGSLLREETRSDGTLVLAVDYAKDERVESLYDDGELFVKASYKGGIKIRDEFYADGKLKRARVYE
jgi:antitoxin component YwqK of YwqJK toxin-antitoxin module